MLHSVWTAATVFLCGILASGAGVGGGALYIPALVIIGGETDRAVPVAKAITFGCAISMYSINYFKSTPIFQSSPGTVVSTTCIPFTLWWKAFGDGFGEAALNA